MGCVEKYCIVYVTTEDPHTREVSTVTLIHVTEMEHHVRVLIYDRSVNSDINVYDRDGVPRQRTHT